MSGTQLAERRDVFGDIAAAMQTLEFRQDPLRYARMRVRRLDAGAGKACPTRQPCG